MLPEDINDIIIAFLLLVLLGSAACVLQSPVGKVFDAGGFTKQAKITTERYSSNFEEEIFLLNYLRTPIEKEGIKFTVADFVLMCKDENMFDYLKKETDKILKKYNKEVNIVILCDGNRDVPLCGSKIEDERTSLIFSEGYGIDVKMYEISEIRAQYGPQDMRGCV